MTHHTEKRTIEAKQTEAQRLADWLQANYEADEIDEAAALLLRQDELLEQALEALENTYSLRDDVFHVATAIRAHREAK